MKTLFICEEFTQELTGKSLNWTEENSIFAFDGDFILSSTFPSEVDFDEHPYFLQYENYNDFSPKTKFDGQLQKSNGDLLPSYVEFNKAHSKLEQTIRAGSELFPTWNTMLSKLPLGRIEPAEGMIAYAESILNKGWPEVTHNFPAIYCKDIYSDKKLFELFFGYYNLYQPLTGFMENFSVPEQNIYINRNIVYPFPYYIHIIKTAVEFGGHTLHGDILNDIDLQKGVMPCVKLELQDRPENIEIVIGEVDVVEDHTAFKKYHSEFELSPDVKYRIKGASLARIMKIRILYKGTILHYQTSAFPPGSGFDIYVNSGSGGLLEFDLDVFFPGTVDVLEGEIIPVIMYDEDGNPIGGLANYNKVDLASNLPHMSFGDLVKDLRAWKNYEFEVRPGRQVWMNLVDNNLEHKNAIDLRKHDVKIPRREFQQEGSFVLKYSEENEEFPFIQTYVDLNGIQTGTKTEDFPVDSNTKEIVINLIPLPVAPPPLMEGQTEPFENAIRTARMITDDTSKPTYVYYDGLAEDGRNTTKSVEHLTTPNLVQNFWFKFMMFHIKSVLFSWSVSGNIAEFFALTVKSKIFAYNNYMIIKSLNRKQKGNYEEIDIEARTY